MNEKKKEEVRGTFEFLKDWGDALTRWTERWIPDALVIVIVLSCRYLHLCSHLGIQTGGGYRLPSLSIGSGMGKRILGTHRLCHADVSHHDDRVHPGLLPSCPKTDEWNLGLVQSGKTVAGYCHDVSLFNDCGMVQLGNQFDRQCHVGSLHCEEKSKSRLSSPHRRRLFRARLHLALRLLRIITPLGVDAG